MAWIRRGSLFPSAAVSDLFPADGAQAPAPIDPLATAENCWCAAVRLFSQIEERHGKDEAQRIFCSLGDPKKARRKALEYAKVRVFVELIQKHEGPLSINAVARRLGEFHGRLPRVDRRLEPGELAIQDAMRHRIAEAFRDCKLKISEKPLNHRPKPRKSLRAKPKKR